LVVRHNCEGFVEQIIMAGGGPRIHRGSLLLPTNGGWSAWTCGARDCPTHSEPSHSCLVGVWWCNRISPQCPGHSSPHHHCVGGAVWTCRAISCPTHSQRTHRCSKGVWNCRRKVPNCPGHVSPDHNCSVAGR
jgi:hypothetical protein